MGSTVDPLHGISVKFRLILGSPHVQRASGARVSDPQGVTVEAGTFATWHLVQSVAERAEQ